MKHKFCRQTLRNIMKHQISWKSVHWETSHSLRARRLEIIISVINQIGAQTFCFTISLFHASTCFEHMCSSSGGQNCITQPLVSSHDSCFHSVTVQKSNALYVWPLKHVQRGCVMQFWLPNDEHMVLETCRGMK